MKIDELFRFKSGGCLIKKSLIINMLKKLVFRFNFDFYVIMINL